MLCAGSGSPALVPHLRLKVAVTERAAVIATVQVRFFFQAPDQPVNCEPGSGVAVRVTVTPEL